MMKEGKYNFDKDKIMLKAEKQVQRGISKRDATKLTSTCINTKGKHKHKPIP